MSVRVAYPGRRGAYSETAARRLFPAGTLAGAGSFEAVLLRLHTCEADVGVLPVSNTLIGRIPRVDDLLENAELEQICELEMRVEHCLLAPPRLLTELDPAVTQVHSHLAAFLQCGGFLGERFPQARRVEQHSTADAARHVSDSRRSDWVAIAGENAAIIYRLAVLAHGISDEPCATSFGAFVTRASGAHAAAARLGLTIHDRC